MYIILCSALLCISIQQNDAHVQMQERLQAHVYALAADSMEGRGIGTRGLEKSAVYIRNSIDEISTESPMNRAAGDTFSGPDGTKLVNIGTLIPGSMKNIARILVVAHYDHLGLTDPDSLGSRHVLNGAHDNASGVAAVLEAGRLLASRPHPLRRTVELRFFSGEEMGLLGSRHFMTSGADVDSIYAVVNVDAVGHLEDGPLISIGLKARSELSDIITGCARDLDLDFVSSPHSYESGDHAPFLSAGIPGFQLTTGPHLLMNSPEDDAETVDFNGLSRIVELIYAVVESLGTRDTVLDPPEPPHIVPRDSSRSRIRFGIVPSFVFSGPGVRAQSILPGSPAERAGLLEGDIIHAVDFHVVDTLGDLAMALRTYEPGDTAQVRYVRDGTPQSAGVIFVERNQ